MSLPRTSALFYVQPEKETLIPRWRRWGEKRAGTIINDSEILTDPRLNNCSFTQRHTNMSNIKNKYNVYTFGWYLVSVSFYFHKKQ